MDNTMAALFFVRWFWRGQRDSNGGDTAKVALHQRRGRAGMKSGVVPVRNGSACFLQSPLCRYSGKESAP